MESGRDRLCEDFGNGQRTSVKKKQLGRAKKNRLFRNGSAPAVMFTTRQKEILTAVWSLGRPGKMFPLTGHARSAVFQKKHSSRLIKNQAALELFKAKDIRKNYYQRSLR